MLLTICVQTQVNEQREVKPTSLYPATHARERLLWCKNGCSLSVRPRFRSFVLRSSVCRQRARAVKSAPSTPKTFYHNLRIPLQKYSAASSVISSAFGHKESALCKKIKKHWPKSDKVVTSERKPNKPALGKSDCAAISPYFSETTKQENYWKAAVLEPKKRSRLLCQIRCRASMLRKILEMTYRVPGKKSFLKLYSITGWTPLFFAWISAATWTINYNNLKTQLTTKYKLTGWFWWNLKPEQNLC